MIKKAEALINDEAEKNVLIVLSFQALPPLLFPGKLRLYEIKTHAFDYCFIVLWILLVLRLIQPVWQFQRLHFLLRLKR